MSATGEAFALWEQENLAFFVAPTPDRPEGQYVGAPQLRQLFEQTGRSYVDHFKPDWRDAGVTRAHELLEAGLHEMRTALGDGDVSWAVACWQGLVVALAAVHPDAALLLPVPPE